MGLHCGVVLSFLLVGVLSHCPQWRCKPLAPFVCAEWTPTFVWVSVEQCPDGLTCSLLDLLPRLSWFPSGQLRCSDPFLPHNSSAINCVARNDMTALVATHPHSCVTDVDCQLLSGALGRCACGLDGTSYCRISEGDSELNEFYSTCSSMSGETAFAWYLFIDFGHMLPRTPWCVKSHFEEINYLRFFLASHGLNSFLTGEKARPPPG